MKMLFKSKVTLGIEITSSQIRFVQVNPSARPARVLDFGVVDLLSGHSENLAQQLAAMVQRRGLENQKASLAVSGPTIAHHVITIPPMSKRDMRRVIEREVKKIISQAKGMFDTAPLNEMTFDWRVIRDIEIGEGKKREVLVAIAPSHQVSTQISLLEQSGLKPEVLTTIPLALLGSLRSVQQKGETVAFVHFGEDEGFILFARNGIWRFSRDFPLGAEESDGLSEVQRSILYFGQHSPGEGVDRVILSGETENLKIEEWSETLGAEVEVFNPGHSLDLTPLGGRAGEFRRIATQMTIPVGLAWGTLEELPINFLSHINGRKPRFIEKGLALPLAAGFLLLAAGGYTWLSWEAGGYRQILQERKASLQKLQSFSKQVEEVQKQRDLYQKRLAFLQQLPRQGERWRGVLQNLSLLVPEEMVFQSLKIKKVKGEWQAKVKGEVRASDPAAALEAFNRFRSGLKTSPLFVNIESSPLKTEHIRSSDFKEKGTKVGFEIKFKVRK